MPQGDGVESERLVGLLGTAAARMRRMLLATVEMDAGLVLGAISLKLKVGHCAIFADGEGAVLRGWEGSRDGGIFDFW